MSEQATFRRFAPDDRDVVYRLFRRSLWAYIQELGMAGPDQTDDVDAARARQGPLMEHLERTAAEDWVAEDGAGAIVGMARSIERDGHLELTHFFVDPSAQASGIGRGLLRRAFPQGRTPHRSIIATQHPRALSLYLRSGVASQGVAATLSTRPRAVDIETDLALESAGADAVSLISQLDRKVLGFRRPEDITFLLADRPAQLLRRDDEVVGYVFLGNGLAAGPAATLDPRDLPVALAAIESAAYDGAQETLFLTLPMAASHGVRWALGRGYSIDPFYEMLLVDTDSMKFDRYLMTQPSFIW